MGLTIVVETETGEILQRLEDRGNILHRLLPSPEDPRYSCLGTIDWYGDTIFNYLQMPLFLDEWTRIAVNAAEPFESGLMEAIETMARRVATERHLYLKFYGD
jgi:hypothetical protein